MSQRKEKYLRHALTRYEQIEKDVEMLKDRTEILERATEENRMARDQLADEMDRREEAKNRKQRRHEEAARRHACTTRKITALCVTALLLAVAALCVAVFLLAISAAMEIWYEPVEEVIEYPASTEADRTAVEIIEDNEWLWEAYHAEIPLTLEEQEQLRAAADEFGVWYPLALAMVDVETKFQNVAGDDGRSIGYLQVNRTYHKDLMAEIGATDLWNPQDNFRTGLAYLAEQIENSETIHGALMAYNMGPTGAARAWEDGTHETEYSRNVLERAEYWATVLGWMGR